MVRGTDLRCFMETGQRLGWIVRDSGETRLKAGGKVSGKEIRITLFNVQDM